jgi:hypothetical protein
VRQSRLKAKVQARAAWLKVKPCANERLIGPKSLDSNILSIQDIPDTILAPHKDWITPPFGAIVVFAKKAKPTTLFCSPAQTNKKPAFSQKKYNNRLLLIIYN